MVKGVLIFFCPLYCSRLCVPSASATTPENRPENLILPALRRARKTLPSLPCDDVSYDIVSFLIPDPQHTNRCIRLCIKNQCACRWEVYLFLVSEWHESLSTSHIDAHHQCWRLIHGELVRLAAPEWKFLCVTGEKCLQTIWNDITTEFEDIQYLNLTQETIWNTTRVREMTRPLTQVEDRKIKGDGRDLLYSGTKKDVRRLRSVPHPG